ncbi:L-serine ammonia-lyase, iron-sulfur-dependent, subunit alpha, partial [Klebsiella pneumoniae]
VPVTVAADYAGVDHERRVRALALSHAVALYAHAGLPVLSAFCAATTAAMGAAAGICLVLDGSYSAVERAVASMTGDVV